MSADEGESAGNDLKAEAEAIVEELSLLSWLSRFGEARVVGSVALDLIVKRDIDAHLLTANHDLLAVAQQLIAYLIELPRVEEVRLSNRRSRGGLKVGIDALPGQTGPWSVDIWITDCRQAAGFALVEKLAASLTAEQREAILSIKRELLARGELKDGVSSRIYEAVIDRGVRTEEQFRKE